MVTRSDLEAMSHRQLIRQAQQLGLKTPGVLTRNELMDEILIATIDDERERQEARGLLGKARDLVARVVQKGLHLPDAASHLPLPPPAVEHSLPPIPTVALAEIYLKQGHLERALQILNQLLHRQPSHPSALKLRIDVLDRIKTAESAPRPVHVPVLDALVLESIDNSTRLTWSIRPTTFARGRVSMPQARLIMRLASFKPSWDGPSPQVQDLPVDSLSGQVELPATDHPTCAALGWREHNRFTVVATADDSI